MSVSNELAPVLKKLRLSGVLQTLDLRTKEAVDDDLSHTEFLLRLCTDEVERRECKQLDLRMRRASFESTKNLEDFDWSFNPQVPKAKLMASAAMDRLLHHAHLVVIEGNSFRNPPATRG